MRVGDPALAEQGAGRRRDPRRRAGRDRDHAQDRAALRRYRRRRALGRSARSTRMGSAPGSARNAHGVDLNRNFSYRWRAGSPSSGYYPGPHPFSEPESRAVRRLIRRLKPRVTIWFHQPWGQVLAPCHGPAPAQTRVLARIGDPAEALPRPAPARHRDPLAEPSGRRQPLSWSSCRAVRSPTATPRVSAGGRESSTSRPGAHPIWVEFIGLCRRKCHRPPAQGRRRARSARLAGVTQKRIPFPEKRKREMAAYSKRHYGKRQLQAARPEGDRRTRRGLRQR